MRNFAMSVSLAALLCASTGAALGANWGAVSQQSASPTQVNKPQASGPSAVPTSNWGAPVQTGQSAIAPNTHQMGTQTQSIGNVPGTVQNGLNMNNGGVAGVAEDTPNSDQVCTADGSSLESEAAASAQDTSAASNSDSSATSDSNNYLHGSAAADAAGRAWAATQDALGGTARQDQSIANAAENRHGGGVRGDTPGDWEGNNRSGAGTNAQGQQVTFGNRSGQEHGAGANTGGTNAAGQTFASPMVGSDAVVHKPEATALNCNRLHNGASDPMQAMGH